MFQSMIINALFTQSIFIAVIRHVLTAVGGAIIAQGWVSSADWTTATGAVVSLVGVLWSILHHGANQTAGIAPPKA